METAALDGGAAGVGMGGALTAGLSEEQRAAVALRLGARIGSADAAERDAATLLARTLAADVSECVRAALSAAIAASPHLPNDLARRLAEDVEAVALPVLELAVVLTEQDLIDLAAAVGDDGRLAIARRRALSAPVVRAIAERADPPTVGALASNGGAEIDARAALILAERADAGAARALLSRGCVPPDALDRLLGLASGLFAEALEAKGLDPERRSIVAGEARRRAAIDIAETMQPEALESFVRHLHTSGALDLGYLFDAACLRALSFVCAALAVRAGVPLHNARLLVNGGPVGIRALCERARVPAPLLTDLARRIGAMAGQPLPASEA